MKLAATPSALLLAFAVGLIDARPVEDAAEVEDLATDLERRSSEIELQRGLRER